MSLTSLKIGAISCLAVGITLGVVSVFIPGYEEDNLTTTTKSESQLSTTNQAKWDAVPGQYNYDVQWKHTLYSIENAENAIFANHYPTFAEQGPYIYQEQDEYSEITYSGDSVSSILSQSTVYVSDPGTIDTQMWLPNQATLRRWHQLVNAPDWQAYMNTLYKVVNYWQGDYLMNLGVFKQMKSQYFSSEDGINQYLAVNNPISNPAVVTAMYTDPNYGLNSFDNYDQWQVLQSADIETTAVNKKLAFQAELSTYWGLNADQVAEISSNWNTLYQAQLTTWKYNLPSLSYYENEIGTAYWQWAMGYATNIIFGQTSLEQVGSLGWLFQGYYEIEYFHTNYFNPTVQYANWATFLNVNFYNDYYASSNNYEHLFTNYDPTLGVDSAPPSNSLFNMSNMQNLISLGQSTPNILTNTTEEYGVTFTLSSDWQDLTISLGLGNEKQTYMIWLWLNEAYYNHWSGTATNHVASGITGNPQAGAFSNLAAQAWEDSVTTMRLELPMFTYASQFNVSYAANVTSSSMDCNNFYTTIFKFDATSSSSLCADPTGTFNFVNNSTNYQGYFKTALALTSIHLYGNQFNTAGADYYYTFQTLTNWTDSEITSMFQSTTSTVTEFMNSKIAAPIYTHYTTVGSNICDSTVISGCSFTNLTYSQWLSGDITFHSLGDIVVDWSASSYQVVYSDYTTLNYPPESYYFTLKGGSGFTGWTSYDCYDSFNKIALYSYNANQMILENQLGFGIYTPYTRYLTINLGLGGLYKKTTPRALIEGYTDSMLRKVQQTPVYMLGNAAISTWVSADKPDATNPSWIPVTFNTGSNDYTQTRQISSWMDTYVRFQTALFDSTTLIGYYYDSPWSTLETLYGTDGWQFSPLSTPSTVSVYFSELCRILSFSYVSETDSAFDGYETATYQFNSSAFSASNGENSNYLVNIDGTTNLTTVYGAPMFATQGNFYGISEAYDVQYAMPTDTSDNHFPTSYDTSNIFYVVDVQSGTTMQYQTSFQTNFQVFPDTLIVFDTISDQGQFIPNVWTIKTNTLSSSTISQLLGYQGSIKTTEYVLVGVCAGVSVITLIVGIWLLIKFFNAKKIADVTSGIN